MSTKACGNFDSASEGFCSRMFGHRGACSFAAPADPPAVAVTAMVHEAMPPVADPVGLAFLDYRAATARLHATELQHEADKKAWQVALAALNRTLVEG